MENINISEVARKARASSLVSIYNAKSGHPGGVLSAMDILAYLYVEELRHNSDDYLELDRDRFILSKGHCAPALYSVAAECGILKKSRLNGLRKLDHELQGHTCRTTTPWVEASTGSLGQGFSFAIGEAKGLKLQSNSNRVYVILGDGELQEGEVWEGSMFSAHHKLDNLCAIVDYNKMQSDDLNKNIMGLEPLADKWKSFGWNVIEINGHDFQEIGDGFNRAKICKEKPTMIIAHTIKGKGVSYMEGSPAWHGSLELSDEDLAHALSELDLSEREIAEAINE